jgi:prepilin-type N-terminal cleavage/methylation domain-containing protein
MKSAYRGFTLVELMIALAIFGFLIMLAGPQLTRFLASSQVRNAAEAMLNGVQQAQATAIKVNSSARLVLDPTTGSGGWQILEMIDGAESAPVQVFNFVDGAKDAAIATFPANATQITFDGFGRIVPNADTTATLRCIDVTNSKLSQARPLRVVISNTTMSAATKLCDPNVASTEPQGCPAACS